MSIFSTASEGMTPPGQEGRPHRLLAAAFAAFCCPPFATAVKWSQTCAQIPCDLCKHTCAPWLYREGVVLWKFTWLITVNARQAARGTNAADSLACHVYSHASLVPRPPREKIGGLVYVVTCTSPMNFITNMRGLDANKLPVSSPRTHANAHRSSMWRG